MTIWEAPKVPGLRGDESLEELRDAYKNLANIAAMMAKDLDFVLNGNIAFDNIRANSIRTDHLEAGSVTAEKMTVEELSAISANLGHITAGLIEAVQIHGSHIATGNGTYPRMELSSAENLLKALANASQYIAIQPFGSNNVPALNFTDLSSGTLRGANVYVYNNDWYLVGVGQTDINIGASGSGDIFLYVTLGNIYVTSWSKLINESTSRTLQQDLDSKANAFSGAYDTFTTADGRTATVINGIITSIT